MNLSRNWLNEFVDLHDITDKQFNDEMTLSGSKVETIERLDESLKNVVAGKILSMEKHPDSDHMWVCQLDVGREEPVQIVTGAWNIHVGDLVPAALHKSVLPGGVKIEKGKLRGVPSNGMLCSGEELGLNDDLFPGSEVYGLLILPGPGREGLHLVVSYSYPDSMYTDWYSEPMNTGPDWTDTEEERAEKEEKLAELAQDTFFPRLEKVIGLTKAARGAALTWRMGTPG